MFAEMSSSAAAKTDIIIIIKLMIEIKFLLAVSLSDVNALQEEVKQLME